MRVLFACEDKMETNQDYEIDITPDFNSGNSSELQGHVLRLTNENNHLKGILIDMEAENQSKESAISKASNVIDLLREEVTIAYLSGPVA